LPRKTNLSKRRARGAPPRSEVLPPGRNAATVAAMKFEKSPPWLVQLFDEALSGTPGERRQMFGCPCGFLGGQMFCGLFGSSLFVRLGEPDRAALLAVEGAHVFDPMGGRPMREYLVVPQAVLDDAAELRNWLSRATAYAASLPPKKAPGKKRAPQKGRDLSKKRARR
jgi:TfoX N-terminal domain